LNDKDKGHRNDFIVGWTALENDPRADIDDRIQIMYFVVGVEA